MHTLIPSALCPTLAPGAQRLGKRLGAALRDVIPLVKALTTSELKDVLRTGKVTLAGHELTSEDLVISRVFEGDKTNYDAAGNPAGTVLVVVNHVLTEDLRVLVRVSSSSHMHTVTRTLNQRVLHMLSSFDAVCGRGYDTLGLRAVTVHATV
jgi:hypothetical protein